MPRTRARSPKSDAFRAAATFAGGPAAALLLGIVLLLVERGGRTIPHDFAAAFFGLITVYAAFAGGALGGIVTGAVGWTFMTVLMSAPRTFFMFEAGDKVRLIVLAFTLPAVSLLVGWLQRRAAQDNARLREAEQLWRLLAEHVPDTVMTVRRDGAVHYANRPIAWTPPEKGTVVGRALINLLPAEHREQVRKMLGRAFTNGGETRTELRLPGRSGEPAMFELRIVPVRRGGETLAALAVFGDVSKRMAEEEAHERLSAIVRASNAAIFGTTADGTVTSWNQGARRIYGYAPEEILGRNLSTLLPEGMAGEEASMLLARAAKGEHVEQVEAVHRRKDGTPLDATVSVSPIGKGGKFVGLAVVVRDVSARRAADEERRKTAELLAEAERIAHVGSWEWETASDEMTWTDELYRIYGLEPGAEKPSLAAYLRQIDTADREKVKLAVKKARADATPFSFDHRILRPDGETRVLRAHGAVQRDASGKPARLVVTVHDVTAFRRMENELRARSAELAQEVRRHAEKLRESELRLETVLAEAPLVVWATDADLRFLYSEGKGLAALALKPGEIVGRTVDDVYKGEPAIIDNHRRALGGETVRVSLRSAGRSYEVTYLPRRDAAGAVTGVIGVALDVTSAHGTKATPR